MKKYICIIIVVVLLITPFSYIVNSLNEKEYNLNINELKDNEVIAIFAIYTNSEEKTVFLYTKKEHNGWAICYKNELDEDYNNEHFENIFPSNHYFPIEEKMPNTENVKLVFKDDVVYIVDEKNKKFNILENCKINVDTIFFCNKNNLITSSVEESDSDTEETEIEVSTDIFDNNSSPASHDSQGSNGAVPSAEEFNSDADAAEAENSSNIFSDNYGQSSGSDSGSNYDNQKDKQDNNLVPWLFDMFVLICCIILIIIMIKKNKQIKVNNVAQECEEKKQQKRDEQHNNHPNQPMNITLKDSNPERNKKNASISNTTYEDLFGNEKVDLINQIYKGRKKTLDSCRFINVEISNAYNLNFSENEKPRFKATQNDEDYIIVGDDLLCLSFQHFTEDNFRAYNDIWLLTRCFRVQQDGRDVLPCGQKIKKFEPAKVYKSFDKYVLIEKGTIIVEA